MQSAGDLQQFLEEHTWSTAEGQQTLETAVQRLRLEEATMAKADRTAKAAHTTAEAAKEAAKVAEGTAEEAKETARLAAEGAHMARAAVVATRQRIEQLQTEQRCVGQGKKGKRAIRLAKLGVHTAQQLHEAFSHKQRLEDETARLYLREDWLAEENIRLLAELDKKSALSARCEELHEDCIDGRAAHSVTAQQLQVATRLNERHLELLENSKRNRTEQNLCHRQKVERLLFEKQLILQTLQRLQTDLEDDMAEPRTSLNSVLQALMRIVGQLTDESHVEDLIDDNPDIQKRIEANANAYAESCLRKENEHFREVGLRRGVEMSEEVANKLIISRGSELSPAPARGGLMLPPRPKKRRASQQEG